MSVFGKLGNSLPEVLVVEDNTDLQQLLRTYLESVKGKLVCAETKKGAEALIEKSLARNRRFRLLVFDYRLPDGNGLQLLKDLRKKIGYKQTPVIMISGDLLPSRMEEIRASFEQVKVMRKPLRMKDFKQHVLAALGERELVNK